MVTWGRWLAVTWASTPLAQQPPGSPLTAPRLAIFKLLSALILLTIGGVSLIVLAWLALRVGRRSAERATPHTTHAAGPPLDDWARKPLALRGKDLTDEREGP